MERTRQIVVGVALAAVLAATAYVAWPRGDKVAIVIPPIGSAKR